MAEQEEPTPRQEPPETETGPDERTFISEVGAQETRKLRSQRKVMRTVWSGFGMFGLVGWSVVVPTLLGAMLGLWLDRHYPARHSWTLALLVAGLCLGCWNAWHWMTKEHRAMQQEQEDKDD